ncbi:MAG TPA: phosphonate metabolism protein/1,5-bisphosphokinase (PRPP-forming) PhnN [Aliidongia sp.]|uniref:phosphonate metabolism protein/1,5-bisphosphokinase (PRPP-forming) PhnN n=1 Tax=Aliidongia sp. TaxID=1914230 RepID=UPI002DDD1431|nr:phosphonate metabolism protein/1,5-bisphosphokinase (PRPP-forming) PhnN [Aliidongia sp.]HEV2677070.1 phosphonate metabolism protein/1,5-bisphosphokinase (PRPP-forming) PhnN [Aliidongia sp.]
MAAPGRLVLVVGPSGSGKDTLIDGAREALAVDPAWLFARRVITRPESAGGEAHEAVDVETFEQRRAAGAFLVSWDTHGLKYGLPGSLLDELRAGRNVVANVSRTVIADLAAKVPHTLVLRVFAPIEERAKRLASRGRESEADVAARLAREVPDTMAGIETVIVVNDGDVRIGIERFLAGLQAQPRRLVVRAVAIDTWRENFAYLHSECTAVVASEYLGPSFIDIVAGARSIRARVHLTDRHDIVEPSEIGLSGQAFAALGVPEGTPVLVERMPTPDSLDLLRRKIQGQPLDEAQYDMVIRDVVEGRYADREISAFLVTAASSLDDREVEALARVRARFAEKLVWDEPIVADKHSLGGIPGSRITLIVVPIVAAHGIAIPKTSSRAITSAAGTADAMEVLARVDLSVAEVRRVVDLARGCVAWNGRINHSPVDDVMNAITRPLGIDSVRWSVASILSKKLAAGATHVVIDVPVGPRAKTRTAEEARELIDLFETVGRHLGLVVEAHATDGSGPIGRGIGPALEVRDALQVLDGDPAAPDDLRDKALFFAGRILAWDPAVGLEGGARRARALLESGAARAALDKIVAAQGRHPKPAHLAPLVREVRAARSGIVSAIDGWKIGGIARRAGAPADKGAGVDLLVPVGARVSTGEPLYLIRSSVDADFQTALAEARRDDSYRFAE